MFPKKLHDVWKFSRKSHITISALKWDFLTNFPTRCSMFVSENLQFVSPLFCQVARYLVKCCRQSKEPLPQSVQYLQGCVSGNSSKPTKPILDIATPYGITELFQQVAKGQISQAYIKATKSSSKLRSEDVWNQASIELTQSKYTSRPQATRPYTALILEW